MSKPEVGLYPIGDRHYPGNSSIVDYGLGINESIMKYSLEEAARGIVREFKSQGKILSQKEAIEIGHRTRAGILKHAADRGTELHAHAYNLINKKAEFDSENDDPYYAGLYLWLKQHDVQPILMEKLLWDEIEGYAGRLDFFGYVDGRLRLMDFKTNRTIQPKMGLQLAGYKHLLEAWGYIEPNAPLEMVILHLTPGIAYEVPFFETWENYKTLKKLFWWKFYRYKPETYLRSPEEAVEKEMQSAEAEKTAKDIKKEAADITSETSEEQELAHDSDFPGHSFPQEVQELLSKGAKQVISRPRLPGNIYPSPEDKSPRETVAPQSQPVRKRGRPRKDSQHTSPSANTSLHRADSQQRNRPEEEELDPKHLHPTHLKREFLDRISA